MRVRRVHPVVRLADGTLLVGDSAGGSAADWQEREFSLTGIQWFRLDAERGVTTGNAVANPDLSKVDEVGFMASRDSNPRNNRPERAATQ